MTQRRESKRSNVLNLMERNLGEELTVHAARHAKDLKHFQFSEAAAQELEASVQNHEANLRGWLSSPTGALDVQMLQLSQMSLDQGRLELAAAANKARAAELELDRSRDVLLRSIKSRSKLQRLQADRLVEASRSEEKRLSVEIDELWLMRRRSPT